MTIIYNLDGTYSGTNQPQPKFDQIIRGSGFISKTGEQTYKITFCKTTEFTLYQVWNPNGNNNQRLILNDTDENWQKRIIEDQKRTGFKPTTIMEVGNKKYAFVIYNAYFNKNNKLTLEVSTKEIVNLSNTVQKCLKVGQFKNARFDIDGNICPYCNQFLLPPAGAG